MAVDQKPVQASNLRFVLPVRAKVVREKKCLITELVAELPRDKLRW